MRKPPHILVTTPESLYLLLTSESGGSFSPPFGRSSWMKSTRSLTIAADRIWRSASRDLPR